MKNLSRIIPQNPHQFIKDACRQSLGAFCNFIYPDFKMPAHIQLLIKKLRAVEEGKLKRLIINMPPRHGKSQLTSRLFPAWFLGRNPKKSIIFTTYSQEFAEDFGRTVRNIIASDNFKHVFPEAAIAPDSASVKRFSTIAGGNYFAVGAGGSITGRGGNLIIVDDPHKGRAEVISNTTREGVINWFKSTLYTRLTSDGAIILIQTRWHTDDLAGYILDAQGNKWEVISMPALDEDNNPLWPEDFNLERLLEIRQSVGEYEWASQYQQSPMIDGGNIIKYEWIRTYKELPQVKMYSWSWDTAIKVGQENDYSVGTLWGECDNGYYLIDMFKQKLEYPELRNVVNMLYNKQKTSEVLIEDKASGQQILQDFRRIGKMPVIAVVPGKDMPSTKEQRMNIISGLFSAGKVFIPEDADWAFDFISEMTQFPNGKHDDICDSTTQYLARRLNMQNKKPNIRSL